MDTSAPTDMTTIRRTKNASSLSTSIKVLAFLVVVAIGAVVVWQNPFADGPQMASVRVVSNTEVSPGRKLQTEGGGRLITFDLGKLKDGETGTITIETKPEWAPIGVERFHELVDSGFFDGCRFFRVVPSFIVQFGITGDPAVQREWKQKGNLKDDPVTHSNEYGTLTFATAGPNTRTTQMFINTNPVGNAFLDKQGFSPIGKVVEGIDYVLAINDEYREKPNQGKIVSKGNTYLEEEFPNLSYIDSAKTSNQ